MIWDIAVVGRGPAGLSAALNASVRNKTVLLIGPEKGDDLEKAKEIQNYLGFEQTTGKELMKHFRNQVEKRSNITTVCDRVQTIYNMGKTIGLLLNDQRILEAHGVVLATGKNFGKTIPGEKEYMGKGVGTCATCDAFLYRNRPVVILGESDDAWEEANFLSELASHVTFVNLTGKKADLSPTIREVQGKVLRIEGDSLARRVVLDSETVEADGIFILREAKSASDLVPGIQTEKGYIAHDANMQTSIPGIFAAGDCTGPPFQVNVATGRGQQAGLSCAKYVTLAMKKE